MSRPRPPVISRVAAWFGWWAGSMLLWLLITSTTDKAEAIVGVGASCLAATAAEIVRATRPFGFAPRARWVVRAWRIPFRIAVETLRVSRVLWNHVTGRKPVRGTYRAIEFRHGDTGPRDGARRALATVAVSVSPNTFVIGFDQVEDVAIVHQLQPDPEGVRDFLEGT